MKVKRRMPAKKLGQSRLPEYRHWHHMMERCLNPTAKKYESYGGRGITVCDEWRKDFFAFYRDMGPRPGKGYSIERKDNNGNYCPENCVWATAKEQSNNRRNNTYLTFRGETHTIAEWARITGISQYVISQRARTLGWTVEDTLTRPTTGCGWQTLICPICEEPFTTSRSQPTKTCSVSCGMILRSINLKRKKHERGNTG